MGHAKFRKVDATVYRYRKHSGGTSWGEFIDLTLDSKIIRRHLNRHPLSLLFSQLDWSFPQWATAQAYLRVAKNLRLYSDHANAIRFLKAIDGWNHHPEVMDTLVKAHVSRGELSVAQTLVSSLNHEFGQTLAMTAELEAVVNSAIRFENEGRQALDSQQPNRVLELARAFIQEHEPTYHTALLRGRACQALGRQGAAPERADALAVQRVNGTRGGCVHAQAHRRPALDGVGVKCCVGGSSHHARHRRC